MRFLSDFQQTIFFPLLPDPPCRPLLPPQTLPSPTVATDPTVPYRHNRPYRPLPPQQTLPSPTVATDPTVPYLRNRPYHPLPLQQTLTGLLSYRKCRKSDRLSALHISTSTAVPQCNYIRINYQLITVIKPIIFP